MEEKSVAFGDEHLMVKRVAKIFMRVDRCSVQMNFIVDVRASGAAATADISDDVTAIDVLAG